MQKPFFSSPGPDETQRKAKILTVRKERCPENHACPSMKVCPQGAIRQKGYAAPTVDREKCIQCGKCVKFCPMKAFVLA